MIQKSALVFSMTTTLECSRWQQRTMKADREMNIQSSDMAWRLKYVETTVSGGS